MAVDGTKLSCSCGKQPVTVVLVGCTQQGKSSLIRAIFDYAGLKNQGDNVKIGNGNSSTTKECTSFEVAIDLRDHFIKDDDGMQRDVNMDTFTTQDVSDLMEVAAEEYSRPNRKHIHLRIIDTPGLDDTDNLAAMNKKETKTPQQGTLPLRVVDEKHKMAILKTLADIGHINSVCFVIALPNPLNFSMQGLLQEYLDIFRLSNLNKKFHFLHTKVDAERLFDPDTAVRRDEVCSKFRVYTASHHFMENLPDPNDPVAVYFSHRAMAKWLTEITSDPSQPVTQLKYPKSQALKTMDKTLQMGIDIDLRYYEDIAKKKAAEITSLEAKIRRLTARKDVQWQSWLDLGRKISALDTTALVEIESRYGYERSHLFSRSRLYWSFHTEHTIRKVTRDPASPSYAYWSTYDDNACVGETYYHNGLTGHTWDESISATIKVFAWKKDVEAHEIRRLKTEREEVWEEHRTTEEEIKDAEKSMNDARNQKQANESQANTCRERKSALNVEWISLADIKSKGTYFATCSLISYAFAVGMTFNHIYKFQFPTAWEGVDVATLTQRYRKKAGLAESALLACEAMLSSLNDEIIALEKAIDRLTQQSRDIANATADVLERTSRLTDWTPSSSSLARKKNSKRGEYEEAIFQALEALRKEFVPVLAKGRDCAEDAVAGYGEVLLARQAVAESAVKRLREAKTRYLQAREKWQDKFLDLQATKTASRAMEEKFTQSSCLGLGPFGVLKEAGDEFGPSSEKTWDTVYYHVREAYLDDPLRFKEVLDSCGV
ncbi:hypothetical protein QBC47DRAFT_439160 [Echria macrotheca]|uniref:G domain-containing protein n=1 Tax=Echria macrotheca TaxID=438768 RepID=A0AAJ0B4J9_9PEZI|nr:hypothetical protein QBC47DRAFT_439160 [Echria macrotheca]